MVFELLRKKKLLAKLSKCAFGKATIYYLGYIISAGGVATDLAKVETMVSWPEPKSIKELRSFLGLTGYYRKFVKDYEIISKPLIVLLKKDAFHWSTSVQ